MDGESQRGRHQMARVHMARYEKRLNISTLGAFLHAAEASGWSVVDLRAFDFIDVYATVVLALLLRHICRNGPPPDLVLPQSDAVVAYLARQDFFRVLRKWYRVDEELAKFEERQWRGNPRVAPLTLIECDEDVTPVAEKILTLLTSPAFGVPAVIAKTVWKVLSETLQNIPQHASAGSSGSEPGFAALQMYAGGVELVIGDLGVGLRNSLSQNPKYANCSNAQAQRLVLEEGASRIPRVGRGNGLNLTAQAIARVGGTMRLQSGDTVTLWTGRRHWQRQSKIFPGTQLWIRIPCN
jgi:hypothetical protein